MSIDPQSKSPLLNLPLELRQYIYSYYLSFALSDFIEPTHYPGMAREHRRPLPSLMLTCKRAYRDLSPTVRQDAAIKLGEPASRLSLAVHGTLRYEHLRRFYLVVTLYDNQTFWSRWLGYLDAFFRNATRLREVVVAWQPKGQLRLSTWNEAIDPKNADRFLGLFGLLRDIRVIKLYGRVPAHWRDILLAVTGARVIWYRALWWVELTEGHLAHWFSRPLWDRQPARIG